MNDQVAQELVAAAIDLLALQGAEALRVREVAQHAGVSTMAVYSRFGDKASLLDAVYGRGFELLAQHMGVVDDTEPQARLVALAHAYRDFAVTNPALYTLMFMPVVGFDPSTELRTRALGDTFEIVVQAAADAIVSGALRGPDPLRVAYHVWAVTHGVVSLELVHGTRSELPGWFLDTDVAAVDVLRDSLEVSLRAL